MSESRTRVDQLRETDNKYEDSIYDLAKEEDQFRDKLKEERVTGKATDRLANLYADKALESMEREKNKYIDEMTGLPNRNSFLEHLPEMINLMVREGGDGVLLMLDFDNFKAINDTYGHQAGDQAIKALSAIVAKYCRRQSDLIYRFGGDEFVVFMSHTNMREAQKRADKIRIIKGGDGQEVAIRATISIGCASAADLVDLKNKTSQQIVDELERRADTALYASKKGGRNRVMTYDDKLPVKEK